MHPKDPAGPAARRRLGRGPGVPVAAPGRREGFPDPAPSRNRGETPGPPATGDEAPEHEHPAPLAGPAAAAAPGAAAFPARASQGGAAESEQPAGSAGPGGAVSAGHPAVVPTAPVVSGALAGSAVTAASGGAGTPASASQGGGAAVPGAPAGPAAPGEAAPAGGGDGRFTVRLANFEGPFDLLLQLISRHRLDVTEVALSKVTDEFMAHIRAMGADWDLDQTTEFLVVAATLLDLKAARLLPAAEVEDEADLALLEARDLLFARLLQYRAYKRIAEIFEERAEAEGRRYPRTVGLEPHHADLLPDVVISIGAEGFARLAVKAMQPKAKPQVYVDHIHAPLVSVREQAEVVVRMLRARGEATFAELTEDAPDTLTVVARFLALLELYREKAVVLDQVEALQALTVRWSGPDDGAAAAAAVTDEFDEFDEFDQFDVEVAG
ncbi:segregation/condensation protein A [Streptomyces venezuelae]|uniref:Segregation and condensation protein A n=1 Tax=Streptomyces venezuelae TaxID=54571 RepID=A0A5P2D7U7_STRVZ|nr:segregation/condensation protein A [Streptomyces venezuelae]QES50823.1 segregation/condensation protein A [Streptomyces venezuelae]